MSELFRSNMNLIFIWISLIHAKEDQYGNSFDFFFEASTR